MSRWDEAEAEFYGRVLPAFISGGTRPLGYDEAQDEADVYRLGMAEAQERDQQMTELKPLPPGSYAVTVVDDTTVEVSEGPFAGRTLKVPFGWQLPKELRKATVEVALEELDVRQVYNRITRAE